MSFPAYPDYRDCGIEWLAEIPAAWRAAKFRHVFRESGEKIEGDVVGPMLSVSGYRGIEIKDYADENQRRSDEDLVGYRIVRAGQLVVNTMWLNYAGLGVSEHEGHVSPAYRSYWIEAGVDRRYVHHLMRSSIYVQGYTQLLTGIRPNSLQMSRDDLMDFPVLLPPRQDQQAIATFLDRETAKIDALVAEQERLIALLKEKRQAVISHAVTKGLNPGAPMKDSGIEWLGEIPAHWDVRRIGSVSTKITNGYVGPTRDILVEDGVRYLQSLHIKRNRINFHSPYFVTEEWSQQHAKSILKTGDVLIVQTGDIGQVAVVPAEFAGCNCHALIIVSPTARWLHGEWLSWVLNSPYGLNSLLAIQTGALHPHLNCGNVKDVAIPLPPMNEQSDLVEHIEHRTRDFACLINEAQSAINLLKERRAALISAAVTGKIDVRNLQAEQTETA